ncbi:MAG TPA: hypothetical protein VHA53_12810, partial [Nitrolancea sp.]|nr:hypothetical protein [Nitrolancea sp.]
MGEQFFDAFFDELDDDTVAQIAAELGLDTEISVFQVAHAEAVAEAAYRAPFGGGLLSLSPHEHAIVHGIDSRELLSQVKRGL